MANNSAWSAHGGTSRRTLLRATAIGVGSTGFAGTGAAKTGEKPTIIDDCTTITEPGRYALSDDIDTSGTTACIRIEADDVVLDGRNHTIDGGGTGRGVLVGLAHETTVENVTVKNLEVTDCTGWAIHYVDATGGAIRNSTVSSTQVDEFGSIFFSRVRNVSVTGCTISENELGVFLTDGSSNNVFARNHITNNAEDGVFVTEFSSGNAFRRNRINDNGNGIGFNDESSEPELVGNTVRDNGGNGISLEMLTGALVEQNRIFGSHGEGTNVGDGIRLVEADENRVVYNVSRDNADDGIDLIDSDDNEIIKNKVFDNGDEPIAISGTSTGNTLSGNVTR